MQLRIQVTNAAYMDKVSSNSVMYELVPRYDVDEEAVSIRRPSWLSSPCVRQSEMLLLLHQHLQRKHPYILLPTFPAASRESAGWGSEALLQSLRRRLERYFVRLLGRPELQKDVALHDFMSSKGDSGREGFLDSGTGRRRSSILGYLSNWFGGSNQESMTTASLGKISRYTPLNVDRLEGVQIQESIEKQVHLREVALQGIVLSTDVAMQAVQRCSEAFGRMSKAIHELTSSHNRHLLSDSYGSIRMGMIAGDTLILPEGGLQDDERFTERRFRELGNRLIDLVNQLRPGLQQIHKATTTSILEVSANQIVELDDVRCYVNKEIFALKRYDAQISRKVEAQHKRELAEASLGSQSPSRPREIARLVSEFNAAADEEAVRKEEYEIRAQFLPSEMETYWRQTSDELLAAISQVIGTSLDVNQLHVDALKAWFPPAE